MMYLVERLVELRRHLEHLRGLKPRVIDIAGELSARRGERFEDYTEAVRNLRRDKRFPDSLVRELEQLPGFRNVLYSYTNRCRARPRGRRRGSGPPEPVEEFVRIVGELESDSGWGTGDGGSQVAGFACLDCPESLRVELGRVGL
jgi:hypothetical protein